MMTIRWEWGDGALRSSIGECICFARDDDCVILQ